MNRRAPPLSSYLLGCLLRTREKYITAKAASNTPPILRLRLSPLYSYRHERRLALLHEVALRNRALSASTADHLVAGAQQWLTCNVGPRVRSAIWLTGPADPPDADETWRRYNECLKGLASGCEFLERRLRWQRSTDSASVNRSLVRAMRGRLTSISSWVRAEARPRRHSQNA